ncbi:carbohydrate ABC transporter permease [Nonomuraea sp. NPDC050536]|uniref:carbohydrate ABC transporter permease n=1 Tax=Nonomuraea sp. NPDC050536 TaxID=3364366 RepID=UPI0037C611FA
MVRKGLIGWGFVLPGLLVIAAMHLFPAAWAFLISRQKTDNITPATDVGWRNYEKMINDPSVWAAVRHTLFYTVLYVPGSIVVGLLLAVALNRKIRFIGFYRTCIFIPFVASTAAQGILANYVFDPAFGGANNVLRLLGLPQQQFMESPSQAMIVLCVVGLWSSAAFNVVIYLAALQDVPKSLTEAAMIDGAGRWRAFRSVVVPHLAPVTVFVAVWQTIQSLQLFDLVFVTTKGQPADSTTTIVYYIYRVAFERLRYGYGSALAYGLFAGTFLVTLAIVVYSRRRKEAF